MRARIILFAADGLSNGIIAHQLHLSRQTVGKWRKRFLLQSFLGLYDEPRPGAPRSIGDEHVTKAGLVLPTTPNGHEKVMRMWSNLLVSFVFLWIILRTNTFFEYILWSWEAPPEKPTA